MNELVEKAVKELPKDIPRVNSVIKSVDTTEEKLEKVKQLKLEITKLTAKRGSRESGHISDLFFYDETLIGLIASLRSELNVLLREIRADRQASKDKLEKVKHEV